MKIVVLETPAVGTDISWDALTACGQVTFCHDLRQEDVKNTIADADIIIPNKLRIDASCLQGSRVKLVCEAATGYNNIDIDYCHEHRIVVTNVRGYSTNSVAQHTIALYLSLSENLEYYCHYVKDGSYSNSRLFCHFGHRFHELTNQQWGIVGLGAIGRKAAKIAEALGARVVYHSVSGNRYDVPYEHQDFDALLANSDVISVHCPLTRQTNALFDKNAFSRMKSSAYLINVARGPIVVEQDLADALNQGRIAGAALDVFNEEPLPANSPLLTVKETQRLLLTPHIAWGSVEARNHLVNEIVRNINSFLAGTPCNVI